MNFSDASMGLMGRRKWGQFFSVHSVGQIFFFLLLPGLYPTLVLDGFRCDFACFAL